VVSTLGPTSPPSVDQGHPPFGRWHFLYFFPLPHGHGSLRPILRRPVPARFARVSSASMRWGRAILAVAASMTGSCFHGNSISPPKRTEPLPGSITRPAQVPAFTLYLRNSQCRRSLGPLIASGSLLQCGDAAGSLGASDSDVVMLAILRSGGRDPVDATA
jgi:hypothetical protein